MFELMKKNIRQLIFKNVKIKITLVKLAMDSL